MMQSVILGALFLTATLAGLTVTRLVMAWLFRPRPEVAEAEETARRPLFGGLTDAIGALVPLRAGAHEGVRKALLKAGFYHPSAFADYRAVRSLLTLFPLFFSLELALLWDGRGAILWTVGYGLLASMIGLSLPALYVRRRGERRSRQIKRALPLGLDLLSLCLTAGVNLLDAFAHVGRQLRATHPVLAGEMLLTHRQAELRSLGHALMRLADRVQTPDVSTVAYTLTQAEELGTNTSAALLELSSTIRTTLRQDAEAMANRTSFWMLFPTTGCLYVAAAIMLIGPGALQLIRDGANIQKTISESQSLIDQANRPVPLPTPPGLNSAPLGRK
ncbi:MAG TPA: type II secretion system F family protein [Gemmataceae bacterium]|nr:type II secretion system F family protein [Gemmataceae bacterium]